MGSSPRMRGTRCQKNAAGERHGIIPAYAGNTAITFSKSRGSRDHPRVCGEHPDTPLNFTGVKGSSPRMRGTRWGRHKGQLEEGIIPAYAGNTSVPSGRVQKRRDHPRVCGEHSNILTVFSGKAGSSPRMRGTRTGFQSPRGIFGIIPAYAGNTIAKKTANAKYRDHPRVCEEHQIL